MLTPEILSAATGCGLMRAATYAGPLSQAMDDWGIDNPRRQAAFLGQVAHESTALSRIEESLTYSALRLTQVWPSRFRTLADAQPFAHNPEALAERVYGGRMGNTEEGDGFLYRGRGLIQLTGKVEYLAYAEVADVDVMADPDALLTPEVAADSAAWFWADHDCNECADQQDWKALTRRINGGTVGLNERIARIQKAMRALGAS